MNKIKSFLSKYWLILLSLVFTTAFIFIGMISSFFDKHSSGITAISALLAAISGSAWFNTSDKKMRGIFEPDIARKYLKSVLKLRDAVKIVRNPFIPIGEMEAALKENELSTSDLNDRELVNRSVYSLRWKNVQDAWTSFEEILNEAEVFWGDKAVKVQNNLDMLIRELRGIVWLFVNYPKDFHQKGKENRELLYGTHDENDAFAKRVNLEIEKIRTFLKKYL